MPNNIKESPSLYLRVFFFSSSDIQNSKFQWYLSKNKEINIWLWFKTISLNFNPVFGMIEVEVKESGRQEVEEKEWTSLVWNRREVGKRD